jgi:hypothetical protein
MAERNMVNLTITMTKEERKALKQIALDKDMTVSALLREWLKEYQIQEGAEKMATIVPTLFEYELLK